MSDGGGIASLNDDHFCIVATGYKLFAIRRNPDIRAESTRSSNTYDSVAEERDLPAEEKTTDCLYEGE